MCIYPQLSECQKCPFKWECESDIKFKKTKPIQKEKINHIIQTREMTDMELAFNKALKRL